jgi:uncharacterized protein (TIGR00369 family)
MCPGRDVRGSATQRISEARPGFHRYLANLKRPNQLGLRVRRVAAAAAAAYGRLMSAFTAPDPGFVARIQSSFAHQRVMALIGAELERVEPGVVEVSLPFRDDLVQQDGFVHAGIVTTIVDSACGYAAYTLAPAGTDVLSVEFKVNLLRPATGDRLLARGEVIKPGRTLSVVRGDVFTIRGADRTHVAIMTNTIIHQKR